MDTKALLEMTYRALRIERPEDKLKGELPAGTTVVTLLAYTSEIGGGGEPRLCATGTFADLDSLTETLGNQAADPQDPNPLPTAVVTFDEEGELILLESLDYNPVFGLDTGIVAAYALSFTGSEEESRELGDGFLADLFEERG